jgi:arylsulfatase A-like enzyme
VISPHDSVYNYYIKKFSEQPLAQRPSTYTNLKRTFEPYPHAAFASMVNRLDRYVGEIVTALKERGELENTLILFTSDNGPHRENGGDPDFFDSNGKFRGIKRDLYEGGIRVPFIAYWKGKIKTAVTDQPAAFWDLYPTFLKLAGIFVEERIDGISLVPTLLGGVKQKQHEYFYWEFHEGGFSQAIRNWNWKAVRKNPGKIEIYNLQSDPGEQVDVSEENRHIVIDMRARFQLLRTESADWPVKN